MIPHTVAARSAIESLRSGVPSRDAVAQLGTTQIDVRDRFEEALEQLAVGGGASPIVLSATFGAGKTHLLEYLQSLAEQQNFVTAYVVISSEMPLGNDRLVVKALAEAAVAPKQTGRALRALAAGLKTDSDEFHELEEWAKDARIADRFRAMLRVYDAFRADEELRVQILNDFEGRPMLMPVLKNRLKQTGQAASYDLSGPKSSELGHDRIRLMARLFRACGCKGLVVLFDEMERVSKFSLKQRLAAYAELGWWRRAAEESGSALLPVFTTASGFLAESVTGGTHDEQRLTSAGAVDDRDRLAIQGIELLKAPIRLDSPSSEQEEEIKYRLKSIYEAAYGAPVNGLPTDRGDVRTSIRSEIRRWITLWDLQRYFPEYRPEMTEEDVRFDTATIRDEDIPPDDEEPQG